MPTPPPVRPLPPGVNVPMPQVFHPLVALSPVRDLRANASPAAIASALQVVCGRLYDTADAYHHLATTTASATLANHYGDQRSAWAAVARELSNALDRLHQKGV